MNIDVYWNLRKKCFSVKNRKTGIVVKHASYVLVKNPLYVVSNAGRERVLRERVKNVHAYVRGFEVSSIGDNGKSEEVTYNPYLYDSFVNKRNKERVTEGSYCVLKISDNKPIIENYV